MRRLATAGAVHVAELDQLALDQPEMGLVQDQLARITVCMAGGGGQAGAGRWQCCANALRGLSRARVAEREVTGAEGGRFRGWLSHVLADGKAARSALELA